jgi:NTE family protein
MADIVVAIDVAGAPVPSEKRDWPSATEALWAASFIFERTIIREKLKQRQPDVYIDAGTGHFQVLDFLKFNEILKRAEPAKERFKAQLLKVLTSETLTLADTPAAPAIATHSKSKRRLGRSRPGE